MKPFSRAMLIASIFLLATTVSGLPTVALGEHDRANFSARLIGINEVPSINTEGSASLRLKLTSDKIDFELTYANLSGPPAAAHIHFGQRHTNGGVTVFFCGGGGKPNCPATTSGMLSGTIVAADVIGPAAQGIDPGNLGVVLRAIRTGATYANMHTAKFPTGEIRGQIGGED